MGTLHLGSAEIAHSGKNKSRIVGREDCDDQSLESDHPQFEGLGLAQDAHFVEERTDIGGLEVLLLKMKDVFALSWETDELYRVVKPGEPLRKRTMVEQEVTFVRSCEDEPRWEGPLESTFLACW